MSSFLTDVQVARGAGWLLQRRAWYSQTTRRAIKDPCFMHHFMPCSGVCYKAEGQRGRNGVWGFEKK